MGRYNDINIGTTPPFPIPLLNKETKDKEMTLRVLLQIVPFGNEEQVYNISKIDISNVGYEQGSLDFYQYTAKQFDEKGTLIMESVDGHIRHKRSKGPWELVKKVLNLKGFLR